MWWYSLSSSHEDLLLKRYKLSLLSFEKACHDLMNQEMLNEVFLPLLQLINQFMKKWKHKHFSPLFVLKRLAVMWLLVHSGHSENTERHQLRLCYCWPTIKTSLAPPVCLTLWEDMAIWTSYKSFRQQNEFFARDSK